MARTSRGSVTAFAVDGASGALKQLNVVDSGGSIPCFVSIHPSGKFLLVANYTGGSYSVTRIKPDGSLGETTDMVKPSGPMSVYQAADRPTGMFGRQAAAWQPRPHDPARSLRPVCGGRRCRPRPDLRLEAGHQHRQTEPGVGDQDDTGLCAAPFRFLAGWQDALPAGRAEFAAEVYGFADGKLTPEGAVHLDPAGRLSGRQHHLGAADRQGGQASLWRQPQS